MGLSDDFLAIGLVTVGGYALYRATRPAPSAPIPLPSAPDSIPANSVLSKPVSQSAPAPVPGQSITSAINNILSGVTAAAGYVPAPVLLPANAPPIGEKTVTGTIISSGGGSDFLTPEGAYKLIKEGDGSYVRTKKMSAYYTWGDFFRTENTSEAELSAMQGGARLATVLDILCRRVGSKISVNSWYRTRAHQLRIYGNAANTPLGSRHIVGDGADITAGSNKTALYRICRSIPEIRRIGYPTNGSGFLHLDLMPTAPAGQQQIFVDNNTQQSNFRNVSLLKPGNSAAYGT